MKNPEPVIAEGASCTPPVDQYYKGGLFLNTLRSVIDDDRNGSLCSTTTISTSSIRPS